MDQLTFDVTQSWSTSTINAALNELEYDALGFQSSYDNYLTGNLTTIDLVQVFLGQPAAVASLNIDTGLSTIEQNVIDILLTMISSLQLSALQAYQTMLSYMIEFQDANPKDIIVENTTRYFSLWRRPYPLIGSVKVTLLRFFTGYGNRFILFLKLSFQHDHTI